MRFFSFLIFLLISIKIVSAQQELIWHIGACTYIDFTSGYISITSSQDTTEGFIGSNTSICNKDSQLVFFSSGNTLFRGDGSIMPDGDTLVNNHYASTQYPFGTVFSQGCIAINKPGSDSIYYLLHEIIDNDTLTPIVNNIYCTTIDITADSGKGMILSKAQPFYISTDTLISGRLQAVRHANGRDWWFISKKGNSNELLEWLITADSVIGPTVIQFSGPSCISSYFAQAIFSEDGNYYSMINWDQSIYLFDFDRCTGNFNLIFNNNLNDCTGLGGGVAFSHNSRYLYATTFNFCFQFDLHDTNIWASRKIIGIYDSLIVNGIYYNFTRMKLAPDKKIYITPHSSNYLWSVINNPDLPDTATDLQQHTVQLYCYNNNAFPNLPNFNLGSLPFSQCDTITGIKDIEALSLKLFPNPCADILKVNLTQNSNRISSVKIYNSMGQLFINQRLNPQSMELTVDVSLLPSGVYFISVEGEYSVARRSFVRM